MHTLSARKLLAANPDVLWEQLTDVYLVMFDDKPIQMHGADITLSRYAWKLHERDPSIALLSSMTVLPYLSHGVFTASTFRELLNHVLWFAYDHYNMKINAYDLVEILQFANMDLYNAATVKTAKYVSSITILDYLDLLHHPLLVEQKQIAEASGFTNASVETAIKNATSLMKSKKLTDTNGKLLAIPQSCLAGIIKPPQAVQAAFMRGMVPDIKMETIPYPLTKSLTEGMNSPLEYAILSREGAIAELASLDDLRSVCYSGRKLALVAQSKHAVVAGDCGATHYVYWTVSEPVIQDGKVVKASDLHELIGIYYLAEDGLRQITENDTHLYGQTIQRRSPLTCALRHGGQVCSTCLGSIASSMLRAGNIGVDIAKIFSQDKAQNALSLKHLLASLVAGVAKLDAVAKRYLTVEDNVYYLSTQLHADKVLVEINRSNVYNLAQLNTIHDVFAIIPSRISSFQEIKLHVYNRGVPTTADITLCTGTTRCMLAYTVLEMLKQNGIDSLVTFNDSSCIIDITQLIGQAIFIRPESLPPIAELSKSLSSIFERSGQARVTIGARDIMGTIERLHDVIQRMGGIHMSILELLLSTYVSRPDEYGIANGINGLGNLEHQTGERILLLRSLASWMIYNSPVIAFLSSPATFTIKLRDDSVLDVFIDAEGVYNYHTQVNH